MFKVAGKGIEAEFVSSGRSVRNVLTLLGIAITSGCETIVVTGDTPLEQEQAAMLTILLQDTRNSL